MIVFAQYIEVQEELEIVNKSDVLFFWEFKVVRACANKCAFAFVAGICVKKSHSTSHFELLCNQILCPNYQFLFKKKIFTPELRACSFDVFKMIYFAHFSLFL